MSSHSQSGFLYFTKNFMQLQLPVHEYGQSKTDYIKDNKDFFIAMWLGGYSWRSIAEYIRTESGFKLNYQTIHDALSPSIKPHQYKERARNLGAIEMEVKKNLVIKTLKSQIYK